MEDAYVDWPFKDPPFIEPYSFELFDLTKSRKWFWKNWTLTLYISAVYVILIYVGQRVMKNRAPFQLRPLLALWNFSLATFSAFAFIRTVPELLHVLQGPNGFHKSVCIRDDLNPSSAWWAMAFSVSKLVELLDTLFIVLRYLLVLLLQNLNTLMYTYNCLFAEKLH
jgi:elongation of very long chain fatty acids protein 6